VPQQVLHNLFEPFVTTRQKGTGLGLAICQRIVSAASGKIVVQTRRTRAARSACSCRLRRAPADGASLSRARSALGAVSGALETPSVELDEPVEPQRALAPAPPARALLGSSASARVGGAAAAPRRCRRQQ
jgi:hypothetical protein